MFGELLNKSLFMLTEATIVYPEGEEAPVELDLSSLAEASSSGWPQPAVIALCAVLAAICIGLTVIILLQKKRASGIGAAIAGSGQTYWSKNKGKSLEGTLEKYTKWGGAAFIIIALVINILV